MLDPEYFLERLYYYYLVVMIFFVAKLRILSVKYICNVMQASFFSSYIHNGTGELYSHVVKSPAVKLLSEQLKLIENIAFNLLVLPDEFSKLFFVIFRFCNILYNSD